MIDEDKLISKLRDGDTKAFSEIYNIYWNKLFYAAKIRLESIEETEDILHDLFLDLWKNKENIFIRSSLSAYLFTSLKYKIFRLYDYKAVREKYNAKGVDEQFYNLEEELNFNELYNLIEEKIEDLPDKCKIIFKMSRFEGKNVKEISEILNLSPNTTQNHINKALKILRIHLGNRRILFFL